MCLSILPHTFQFMTQQFHNQQRQNTPLVFTESHIIPFPSFFIFPSFILSHCSLPRKLSLHTVDPESPQQEEIPMSTPSVPAQQRQSSAPQRSISLVRLVGSLLRQSNRTETDADRGRAIGSRERESHLDTKKQASIWERGRQQAARPSGSRASPALTATPVEQSKPTRASQSLSSL